MNTKKEQPMSITCKSVNIHFDNDIYLNQVNLSLPEKKIVLLLGPSGSGKTALFNRLCGLEKPVNPDARIYWFDYPVSDLKDANKVRSQYISMIFSFYYFVHSLSVEDNIVLPAVMRGESTRKIRQKLDCLISTFSFDGNLQNNLDLKIMMKKPIARLSNGQKELVSIARAFMLDTPYVFADEMLRSFNRSTEQIIWKKLLSDNLGIGKTRGLFWITHKERLTKDDNIHRILTIENQTIKEVEGDQKNNFDHSAIT
jgi:ABC-type lipoprotein export system ATPase subunit